MKVLVVQADRQDARRLEAAASPGGVPESLRRHLGAAGVDDVRILRLAPFGPAATGTAGALSAAAAQAGVVAEASDGVDVLHALDLASAVAALAARRDSRVPVLARVQLAGVHLDEPDSASVAAVVQAADAVQSPTRGDAQLARRLGADPERTVTALGAALVAHDQFGLEGEPYGDHDRPSLALLSGVPWSRACLTALIRAMLEEKQLEVTVAGVDRRCPAAAALLDAARRYGVNERLRMRGWLPPAQLAQVVDGSAAVLSVRTGPGVGMAPLTAMARSRAVVASTSAAVEEVVVDGVTGLMTDVEDPTALTRTLVGAVEDSFRCQAWGVAGLDRFRTRFAPEQVLAALRRGYAAAVGRGSGAERRSA